MSEIRWLPLESNPEASICHNYCRTYGSASLLSADRLYCSKLIGRVSKQTIIYLDPLLLRF